MAIFCFSGGILPELTVTTKVWQVRTGWYPEKDQNGRDRINTAARGPHKHPLRLVLLHMVKEEK